MAAVRNQAKEDASESLVSRLAKDLGFYAPARLISALLNLGAVAIFTRVLDQATYGAYAIVVAGVALAQSFSLGWLNHSALRHWESSKGDPERFLSSLLALLGMVLVTSALLWPAIAPLLFPGVSTVAVGLGWVALVSTACSQVVQVRRRAARELGAYAIYNVLQPVILIALGLVLVVVYELGAEGLLIALAAGHFLVVLIEVGLHPSRYRARPRHVRRAELAKLWNYGGPMIFAGIAGATLELSDRFLVAQLVGLGAAGVYTVAYTIAFKMDTLLMMVLSAAFPILVQDYEREKPIQEIGRSLSKLITLYTLVALPSAVGLVFVADGVATVVLGPDFRESAGLMKALAVGVFALGLTRYFTKGFQLAADTRPQVLIFVVAAAINIGLNLAFIPKFGALAAAWSTSASTVVLALLAYVLSRRFVPYSLEWGEIAKLALASAIMGGAVNSVAWLGWTPTVELLLQICVGVTVFATIVLVLDVAAARARLAKLLRRPRRQ